MNLFQKHQKTSGYNTIPDGIAEVETAAVPVGSTLLPPTMTMTTMSKTRIVLVAGMTMMLVAGGGTLWMRETMDAGRTTMTTAEGLVVGTEANHPPCTLTLGTFNGVSTETVPSHYMHGRRYAFQTCYQFGLEARLDYTNYCWTNSFYRSVYNDKTDTFDQGYHTQCVPDGPYFNGVVHVDPKRSWHTVHAVKPQTSLPSCGRPCPGQHECFGDDCERRVHN